MSLTGTNLPDRKTWSTAASPSNLTMAALVGFLFVGQATDWKILGRKAKPNSSITFGTPVATGKSAGATGQHSHPMRNPEARNREVRNVPERNTTLHDAIKSDSSSAVADRRPGSLKAPKGPSQLD